MVLFFFFQAEDGIRDLYVTGVQTCALPISAAGAGRNWKCPDRNRARGGWNRTGGILAGGGRGRNRRNRHQHRRRRRRSRPGSLFPDSGGVNVALSIESEGGDFFLGSAVENEPLSGGRDAVHQSAAIGAGNQISARIQGQHADVSFVALE